MNQNKQQSGLGIAALILSIIGCTFLIGLILAIIDLASNNGKSKTLSKIALVFCGLWLVVGIIGVVVGSGDKTSEQTTTAATTEIASEADDTSESTEAEATDKVEPKFENNVIVTDDYTMEILDYKVIQPGEEGNKYGSKPVIAFWYNTTNTSGNEIDPNSAWIFIMTAVQDNDPNMVNELSVGMLPDDSFTDSQMNKIKAGGTVENAVSYELTDTETPVVLTAKNGMLGGDIGSQTFEIK